MMRAEIQGQAICTKLWWFLNNIFSSIWGFLPRNLSEVLSFTLNFLLTKHHLIMKYYFGLLLVNKQNGIDSLPARNSQHICWFLFRILLCVFFFYKKISLYQYKATAVHKIVSPNILKSS